MYAHSVMFHHFHNKEHIRGQGSIGKKKFIDILDFLEKNFNLLGADKFSQKIINGTIKANDIVLSFDDALKCQFDIAGPILKERNISSFFFIYSSKFIALTFNILIGFHLLGILFNMHGDSFKLFCDKKYKI